MPRNHLIWGDWNAICDVCGRKRKASQMRQRWDGLMTCEMCWETRHPQEFLRIHADDPSVPWTRPQQEPDYINICYIWNQSAYADLGTADCMLADFTPLSYEQLLALLYSMSGYTTNSTAIPGYATPGVAIPGTGT